MIKLERIHRIFTTHVWADIQDFYRKQEEFGKAEDLFVDADSLQWISSFMLIKSQCSKLLVDLTLIEEFVPESI